MPPAAKIRDVYNKSEIVGKIKKWTANNYECPKLEKKMKNNYLTYLNIGNWKRNLMKNNNLTKCRYYLLDSI